MDTNALKKFAQAARNLLIDQVTSKLALVIDPASPARREHPQAMKALDATIAAKGKAQVIEQVAYTWFNRFTALRFMDVNGYTNPRVVSPADGATRPEILADAVAGNLLDGAPGSIAALLDGRTPSNDPQAEAYRLLLVHACNQWHGPMPFLFEQIDDYSELLMPEDLLSPTSILAELRKSMTEDACQDVEVIGWLYQFYISEKKDQVFAGLKKNIKITAENIPAATQLFTPHWIVRYLVENSLGRLWLLNRPQSKLAAQMDYYIAPEEPETDFLAITKPEDIRICDPAAGSGHMLTYAFDLLHAIYEEEGYEPTEIPALILTHNLHGVEIDDRAGALAAFALVMKAAAKLGRRRFLRLGVQPNICVMQDVRFTPAEMQDVAAVVGRDLFTADLRETLGQFEQAKNFGSLIVPKLRDPAEVARVVRLKDFGGDLLLRDVQERVLKVLEMAEALSPQYHVVVANPPYAGASNVNNALKDWLNSTFPDSKSDLFSAFIQRGMALVIANGNSAFVTMMSWLFISSYEKLRKIVLKDTVIADMTLVGFNSFPEINSKVAQAVAFVLKKSRKRQRGRYLFLNGAPQSADKDAVFQQCRSDGVIFSPEQESFELISGSPIAFWLPNNVFNMFRTSGNMRENATDVLVGLFTNDNDRFLRFWCEVSYGSIDDAEWRKYNKAGGYRKWYGIAEHILHWGGSGAALRAHNPGGLGALRSFDREHVVWGRLTSGDASFRIDKKETWFDNASPAVVEPKDLYGTIAYLNSHVSRMLLRTFNPTVNLQAGDISKLPYPPASAMQAAAEIGRALVSAGQSDWDAYETSWDFTTLPLLDPAHRGASMAATYQSLRAHWQGMTDKMQRLEEENNSIFIDAYGLLGELTPEVPLEEITLTCNPAYRYGGKATETELEARLLSDTMAEFLHYAVGCMFGRYSLDAPGLILANQGEGMRDFAKRMNERLGANIDPEAEHNDLMRALSDAVSFVPDADNVIPVLDGDWFADDITERFRKFLRVTFGEAKFQENLAFIETALGKDIRKYFTKDFFEAHVRRYKKRPIYWMFSSPKGTFNALIYMHRYRPDTVSVVRNEYLREFISKLEAERGRLEKLADDPNATQTQRTKAVKDTVTVSRQLDELIEWEREVVLPLAQAKIEIDLDDGVKRNYPLFVPGLKPIKGLEAADE
jgi:hypothetical protein